MAGMPPCCGANLKPLRSHACGAKLKPVCPPACGAKLEPVRSAYTLLLAYSGRRATGFPAASLMSSLLGYRPQLMTRTCTGESPEVLRQTLCRPPVIHFRGQPLDSVNDGSRFHLGPLRIITTQEHQFRAVAEHLLGNLKRA